MSHRLPSLLLACALVLAAPALSQAQNGMPDDGSQSWTSRLAGDVYVAIGVKAWVNDWDLAVRVEPSERVYSRSFLAKTSLASDGFNVAAIPSLSLLYKRFFVSGGYFTAPEYDFETLSLAGVDDLNEDGTPIAFRMDLDHTIKRTEYDLNIGYFILPGYLSAAIGYKKLHYDVTSTMRLYNPDGSPLTQSEGFLIAQKTKRSYDIDFSGPTVGLIGSAPMARWLSMYGNLAAGYLQADVQNSDETAVYLAGELGLASRPLDYLTVTLGYKFQTIDYTIGDSTLHDLTKGPVAGVNFFF